jgi:elongation factor Ts
MMDCKAALIEAGGDMEKAEELLRKKLKGKMDTRTDRAAGEGRIGVAVSDDHTGAAIIEVRAESDFTAKNEAFVAMVQKVAKLALKAPAGPIAATPEIGAAIDEVRIATGENCSFARGFKLQGTAGSTHFGTYVHHDGKTGSIVQGEKGAAPETLRQICMHVVAASPKPQGVAAADVPAAIVEKERKFRIEQAMESGKPKEIAEKMVEGGMRKFFEEITLLEQPFIMDPTKKVKDLLTGGATVSAFQRWQVGEQA